MGSLTFRVSDDQRSTILKWAEAEGRSTGDIIRRRLFGVDLPDPGKSEKIDSFQMEHIATDAAHRPVPQALEVRNATTTPLQAEHLDSISAATLRANTGAVPNWTERNAAQTARDAILRGINKKGK